MKYNNTDKENEAPETPAQFLYKLKNAGKTVKSNFITEVGRLSAMVYLQELRLRPLHSKATHYLRQLFDTPSSRKRLGVIGPMGAELQDIGPGVL